MQLLIANFSLVVFFSAGFGFYMAFKKADCGELATPLLTVRPVGVYFTPTDCQPSWGCTPPPLYSPCTVGAISIAGAKSIAGAVFINKIVNLKFF